MFWSTADDASGYEILYLPFTPTLESDISNLGFIDMQQNQSLAGELEAPAYYQVAVRAYNCTGYSDISNVGVIWLE